MSVCQTPVCWSLSHSLVHGLWGADLLEVVTWSSSSADRALLDEANGSDSSFKPAYCWAFKTCKNSKPGLSMNCPLSWEAVKNFTALLFIRCKILFLTYILLDNKVKWVHWNILQRSSYKFCTNPREALPFFRSSSLEPLVCRVFWFLRTVSAKESQTA